MTHEDQRIIAKAIWDYYDSPWDFEWPTPGMAQVMKRIVTDQASMINIRLMSAGKLIRPIEPTTRMLDAGIEEWNKWNNAYNMIKTDEGREVFRKAFAVMMKEENLTY